MKSSVSSYFIFATVVSLLVGASIGYCLGVREGARMAGGSVVHSGSANSFEDCVDAGNPVMESYPRQCRTKDGKLFVEDVKAVHPTQPPKTIPPAIDPEQPHASAKDGCVIGGCSAQLCGEAGDEPLISTCEFREEYSCYKFATCEKQSTGKCGWTQTASLNACLKNPPPLI